MAIKIFFEYLGCHLKANASSGMAMIFAQYKTICWVLSQDSAVNVNSPPVWFTAVSMLTF